MRQRLAHGSLYLLRGLRKLEARQQHQRALQPRQVLPREQRRLAAVLQRPLRVVAPLQPLARQRGGGFGGRQLARSPGLCRQRGRHPRIGLDHLLLSLGLADRSARRMLGGAAAARIRSRLPGGHLPIAGWRRTACVRCGGAGQCCAGPQLPLFDGHLQLPLCRDHLLFRSLGDRGGVSLNRVGFRRRHRKLLQLLRGARDALRCGVHDVHFTHHLGEIVRRHHLVRLILHDLDRLWHVLLDERRRLRLPLVHLLE
mmetsp:Transcript_32142/g.80474  ORF Transcript_32142/g.80474 Transcript_32142/m.80474 type:complete len:256 (+) Transcript_32142:77-844(+)